MTDTEDAERTILGAVLVNNRALVSVDLIPGEFADRRHATIYRAMRRLDEMSEPIDLVTLKNVLARSGAEGLEDAGGVAYLAGLIEGTPRIENVTAWVRIVQDASTLRRLGRGLKAAAEAATPEAQVAAAEAVLRGASAQGTKSGTQAVGELVRDTFESIERIASHQGMVGLSTGFADLDKMLCGLKGGDLIVVAGRPGMGKSSLALQIARASSARTLFISLEMTKVALVRRILAADSQVNQRAIQFGLREHQWQALARAAVTATTLPIWLNSEATTVMGVRREAKRIDNLGLIVVDYLQLMEDDKGENRQQQIAGISRGLKRLAEELNVPVIALSQLSRPADKTRKDKRPQLTDLRESGAIEQDADAVVLIHREETYNPTDSNAGKAELIVAKQRDGDTGTVRLNWDKTTTRFFEDIPEEPTPTQESLL